MAKHLVFSVGDREFAVSIENTWEIRQADNVVPLPESPPWLRGVMDLRGKVIPVVDLASRFGFPPEASSGVILVAESGGEKVGFLVRRVLEVLDLPPEMVEPPPAVYQGEGRRFVRGVVNLKGRILILISLSQVLEEAEVSFIRV